MAGRQQEPDGGFGFAARPPRGRGERRGRHWRGHPGPGRGRDPRAPVARAEGYLRGAEDLDGGFPQQPGEGSNAQSTAWAVQGLDAAGANVAHVRHGGSVSPLEYLEGLMGTSGSVRYSRTSSQTPVWVTAQALAALAARRSRREAGVRRPDAAPGPSGPGLPPPGPRDLGDGRPPRGERTLRRMSSALSVGVTGPTPPPARGPAAREERRTGARAERRLGRAAPPACARWSLGLAQLVPAVHLRDAIVLSHFTQLQRPHVNPALRTLLHLLDPTLYMLWGIALVALALARSRPRVALAIAVVLALAPLSAEVLKPLLGHGNAGYRGTQLGVSSWPSGHATAALTLALCAVLAASRRLARGRP